MSRAMFVSLAATFPELVPAATVQGGTMLRNATCVAWRVALGSAQGVEFLFGVYQRRVVSAYRVVHPVADWPVIPAGAIGEGRRCVPVVDVSATDWERALTWAGVDMHGPLRYGDVDLDAGGSLHRCRFDDKRQLLEDELPDGS